MSLDLQDGVVDPDGRVFGIDNLYLTGASVLPTAGFANPTLTIVALARSSVVISAGAHLLPSAHQLQSAISATNLE
jgi:choline dehydrogenase-like flavoprotein